MKVLNFHKRPKYKVTIHKTYLMEAAILLLYVCIFICRLYLWTGYVILDNQIQVIIHCHTEE